MSQRIVSIILTVYFVVSAYTGWGQNSPGLKTVVAPSPNASALGKYGEIPVSMYTGIPNINIPLYTLKGRELEVPISLNYHAGGVRVEEIASWVGIGWSLNAGGIITRTIRGAPDDVLGGYFGSYAARTTLAEYYYENQSIASSTEVGDGNALTADMSTLESIRENILDGEPDIYYFNFGKYTGSFFMNQQGQLVVSPLEALKVQYSLNESNQISQWILTTPDGVRYIFGTSMDGTRSALESNSNGAPWPVATTGWYLEDIYSPHADTISFNYTDVSYSYPSRFSEVLNVGINGNNGAYPYKDNRIGLNNMIAPRLISITSANGGVGFGVGANRTDLPGEAPLTIMNIYNKVNAGTLLQKWQFNYDYSTDRLTLDSLQEYSADGTLQGQGYKFAYNGSLPDPNPNGIAINSQDLWGYYNGVTNSVLPQGYSTTTEYGPITINGADRHSDGSMMQAGVLTQITYPTGGYSHFDYEANTVYQSVVNNSIPSPGVPEQAGNTAYFYNTSFSDTFTIVYPNPATGTVSVTVTAISMLHTCPFDNNGFSQCYYATLKGIDGTSYPLTDFPDGETTITLLPGTYVISGTGAELSGQTDNVYRFFMDWTEYPPPPTETNPDALENIAIGGLRILRITNFDGSGTSITKYLYNRFNDTASSAVLVNQPYNYVNAFQSYQTGAEVTYLQVKSFPLIPLMPTQGAAIGYQNVTKLSGENGENGKEEYTYTTANDFGDEIEHQRPYSPSCSFDWRRGQLLRTTTYANNGGTFVPISAEANSYINGIKQSVGYGITVDWDAVGSIILGPLNYYASGYRTVSEFQYLQTDTNWLYDQNNPSSYIQTIHSYTYDTVQGHYQLTKTVTRDSKNQVEEMDYQYPQDLTLSGYEETARQNLISQFILTPVLDKKIIRNGVQATDTKNNYMVFSNGYPLPQSIDLQTGAYPLDRRIDFLQYDNYANLASQQKASDMLTTYIWDYSHSYPIASVANGDSADVAYTSFEADGSGGWTISGGAVDGTTGITGANSYNLSGGSLSKSGLNGSTTYIVSYWTQNNAAFYIPGTISGYPVKGKTVLINNNNWTLFVHKVTGQNTITFSGTGHIDELRLYPSTAQITTYTYTPLVGMTSQTDVGNRVTYYEYDGLQRLKRIRDQDYNILKTFEYQYQTPGGCGSGCAILTMETLNGSNTPGYPVGVFDIHGNLVRNATGATNYVSAWNSDTADARVGSLAVGQDSLHFKLTLNSGQTAPSGVTGCRYYQYDLSWNILDGITCANGAYVDFGDSIHMTIPATFTDTPNVMPLRTTHVGFYPDEAPEWWFVHTYPDTTLKTITIYHNDDAKSPALDDGLKPATSLTLVRNFRGNIPQQAPAIGGSCYQQASALSVANISNWSSISSITGFWPHCGDKITACEHMSYAQDFMASNRGLQVINTTQLGVYESGYTDTTFKLSRLKSDWNTYFTNLQDIEICDDQWNHEDVTALTQLHDFALVPGNQNHSNTSTGNPLIPIDSAAIDALINQIANGAAQSVPNGWIWILTGGSGRTHASDTGLAILKTKGWTLEIDNVFQ